MVSTSFPLRTPACRISRSFLRAPHHRRHRPSCGGKTPGLHPYASLGEERQEGDRAPCRGEGRQAREGEDESLWVAAEQRRGAEAAFRERRLRPLGGR